MIGKRVTYKFQEDVTLELKEGVGEIAHCEWNHGNGKFALLVIDRESGKFVTTYSDECVPWKEDIE